MGARDTRFGRNTDPKLKVSNYDILYPNPRAVSKVLLERDSFKKVPFLNLIAVGWIQFMTHDWFSHGDNLSSVESAPFYLPLAKDDELGDLLIFPRSTADASMSAKERELFGQSFQNEVTHWWDASQIYGSTLKTANSLRSFQDGQLKLGPNGQLPLDGDGIEDTGFKRNWWLGLSILHNLFTKEHNFIANRLKDSYPHMSDEELYQTARLINAALLAKIHTIEWTPAILPSSYMRSGMRANWSGLANKGGSVKPWYEFFKSDFLFGIVGGNKTLADVPFAMTEEFVSVYRMHPLLPDFLKLTKIDDTQSNQILGLNEVRKEKVAKVYKDFKMEDVLYSFGQMHPGQLVLNNYPKSLMNMEIPLVAKMDLAAMDILRDRERGVPRYNEFRRQMQLKPIKSLE